MIIPLSFRMEFVLASNSSTLGRCRIGAMPLHFFSVKVASSYENTSRRELAPFHSFPPSPLISRPCESKSRAVAPSLFHSLRMKMFFPPGVITFVRICCSNKIFSIWCGPPVRVESHRCLCHPLVIRILHQWYRRVVVGGICIIIIIISLLLSHH